MIETRSARLRLANAAAVIRGGRLSFYLLAGCVALASGVLPIAAAPPTIEWMLVMKTPFVCASISVTTASRHERPTATSIIITKIRVSLPAESGQRFFQLRKEFTNLSPSF